MNRIAKLGKLVAKVITGAGSGIGEATARRFSQEGASVVLAGNTKAKLDKVARELPSEHTLVKVIDVSNYKQVQALVAATIKRLGALHVLFNNAGIAMEGTVTEALHDGWDKIMATNAGGVLQSPGCCRGSRRATAWSGSASLSVQPLLSGRRQGPAD